MGLAPKPRHRPSADELRARKEARDYEAVKARWEAAGCKPLDPVPQPAPTKRRRRTRRKADQPREDTA